jgi:hypothetical protein
VITVGWCLLFLPFYDAWPWSISHVEEILGNILVHHRASRVLQLHFSFTSSPFPKDLVLRGQLLLQESLNLVKLLDTSRVLHTAILELIFIDQKNEAVTYG